MAQSSWPDPGSTPPRQIDDRQYELLSARHSDDGLYGVYTDPAPVYADGTGMQVKIRAGLVGSVRGHGWTSGDEVVVLPVDSNSSGQPRLDRVVLRLDRSTWTVRAAVRKGTSGTALPALVRDAGPTGLWEAHLGQVTVPNGAVSIQAGNVVARPLYVGARVRQQHSGSRNPNPIPGEIGYDHDTGRWVGWNGDAWRVIYPVTSDIGPASLELATNWVSAGGPNDVRRLNGVVYVRMNVKVGTLGGGGMYPEFEHNGVHIATIPDSPAGLRPVGYTPNHPVVGTSDIFGRLDVNADGRIFLTHVNDNVFEGCSFRVCFPYVP